MCWIELRFGSFTIDVYKYLRGGLASRRAAVGLVWTEGLHLASLSQYRDQPVTLASSCSLLQLSLLGAF